MAKGIKVCELREQASAGRPITDEDREFMRKMTKRMPNLSIRRSEDRAAKVGSERLEGGYLLKFRRGAVDKQS